MDKAQALQQLHADLSLKRLNRGWAKIEILLGLSGAGTGLLLGNWAVNQGILWPHAASGVLLFVLSGYLALAGHRSHLYQSNNQLAAYLAELIRGR